MSRVLITGSSSGSGRATAIELPGLLPVPRALELLDGREVDGAREAVG